MIDLPVSYLMKQSDETLQFLRLKTQDRTVQIMKRIRELERKIKQCESDLAREAGSCELVEWMLAHRDELVLSAKESERESQVA